MTLSVTSAAFREGETIPSRYTCEGEDISPPLAWDQPPEGTRSLVLIVDDPDAPGGTFTHWVLFNLPAGQKQLPEAVPSRPQLDSGARQGKTDFGREGYGGPCPPPGNPHRYRFTVYALDRTLDLEAGALRPRVEEAMQGAVLARGRLTGFYQR